jgi:hypothetical protein
MKNKILTILLLTGLISIVSCTDLDLNPLSEGSSANWYSTESEITMALNDLYRIDFWPNYLIPYGDLDYWTDDEMSRATVTAITGGTLNGQDGTVNSWWTNLYKGIARANTILANLEGNKAQLPQATFDKYAGEARFVRAAHYARLITYWGDVIYYTDILDLEESFKMSKTDKKIILKAIYDDYDFAASKLPLSYGSTSNLRATKGAALAMKARVALFFGDWAIARDAAKACMDLGVYELHSDYATLFLSKTKNPKELIFGNARSTLLNVTIPDTKNWISRLAGGWGGVSAPSWQFLCSYLCTDGLPIDESPLFDPRNPFKNRDPRCTATIVEFQTPWLGFMYQPHPDTLKVTNFKTGGKVTNNDNRANAQFASFNGLMFKKGIDEDWTDDYKAENTNFIMRYADVLLMYAEAKTELGEIDQEMLDASINKVRARAYKVAVTDKTKYPPVIVANQATVRKAVRNERRVELVLEGRRYEDLIRWKLAEKLLSKDMYGMLDPADLRAKVVKPGLWFFPQTPSIDEDGDADFETMYNAGLVKLCAVRNFPSHQYLWPIPTKEILINQNLEQNQGY